MTDSDQISLIQKRFGFRDWQIRKLRQRITDVRRKIGTQRQVADQIGISQGHLSRLENGNHNAIPGTDYLQQLAKLAGVSYLEQMLWIGMAGHLPWTQMPDTKQIKSVLEIYCKDIARDVLPSYIVDYRMMVWAHNQASYNSTSYETGIQILQNASTLFDVLFKSDYRPNGSNLSLMDTLFEAERAFQRIPIRMFYMVNLMRQHEPFYQLYPRYIEDRLCDNAEDVLSFRKAWNETMTIGVHDDEYYSSIVREHVESGVWLRPLNFRGINNAAFKFSHHFEIIPQMPQFMVVRLRAQDSDPQTQSILSALNIIPDNNKPLYQALWQPAVDGEEIMSHTVARYNADNLYET